MKRAGKGKGVTKNHKKSQIDDIYELSETGNNILNLSLQFPEMTDEEIGLKVGIVRETVNRIKNTPAYKQAYKQSNYEAMKIIKEAKTKAAKVMSELLDNDNPKVKFDAAKTILGDVLDPKNINLNITDKDKLKSKLEDYFE